MTATPDDENGVLAVTIDAAQDAIVLTNAAQTITSWNSGATAVYGYTAEEAIGRGAKELLLYDEQQWEEALLGKTASPSEGRTPRKDGVVVTVSETLAPIFRDGQVLGVASISRDVSERRRTDEALAATRHELERNNERLVRANDELEQFAYVASHELSEPLRAVAGMVELLGRRYRGSLDDDADEFIDFAIDGCVRMKAMIDDLLAYARVGRSSGARTSVDVGVVMSNLLITLDPEIVESGATVACGELPTIVAEPTELGQVLQNLLSNAIKFRRPGISPKVEISAERDGSAWRFCVADNGIGINPQHTTRIFRMFQQLHARNEYPGTGIGLAIADRIVTDLGGRLWVDDRRTGGSRFCFTVPDPTTGAPR